ncbi:MAG TPA: DUF1501 domain-containing protein [Stellaceae bacterium]|jgi:uncharacterized protein (DUF1501 family)|nr:DUF1501 domain-containing protein [Stellaceae bacterium]
MRRRDFFGLATSAALISLGGKAWAAEGAGGPKRLVVAMLRGAVDGLNVVVPYGEEAYYAARPTIAVPRPGSGEGGALPLDGHFALHPALAGLLPMWEAKQLAFVHATGSPDPTRSHFDAQLFVENGTPGRRATADGWMNRLLATLPQPIGPTAALAVGPTLPQILRGRLAASNLPMGAAAASAMAIDRPAVAAAFDSLYSGNDQISQAYRQGRTARAELIADMPNEEQMAADAGAPPPNALPAQAARLAKLIGRDRNIRLAFAAFGGWDTHVRQGADKGQLAARLRPLGDGLASFARALGSDWQDTVVVVVSEFGRTVHENGNGGTDHGHGNVMWVMGGGVRGGQVYGQWPGLAAAALYEGRDLAVTTDYRAVLAGLTGRHLRLPDNALTQIFPGFTPPRSDIDSIVT